MRCRPALTILICWALLALLAQPTAAARKLPWQNWKSTLNADHKLVGRIWSVADKRFLSPVELRSELAFSDFILLGEVHDNPDHHRLQAWLVASIASHSRSPAVVMEMISLDQAEALKTYLNPKAAKAQAAKSGPHNAKPENIAAAAAAKAALAAKAKTKAKQRSRRARKSRRSRRRKRGRARVRKPRIKLPSAAQRAAGMGAAIGWSKRGWPAWPNYQPIAEAAFARALPIVPGDARKSHVRSVGKSGFKALAAGEEKRLSLDTPLEGPLAASLKKELAASHCGLLPERALGPMSRVQRFRDATLADQMLSVGIRRGAILIAGDGHVRNDRGVPWYIARRAPDFRTTSLMLVEVDASTENPEELVPKGADGKPATDYIWVTPRHDRPDPCEEMKKRFGKHKK